MEIAQRLSKVEKHDSSKNSSHKKKKKERSHRPMWQFKRNAFQSFVLMAVNQMSQALANAGVPTTKTVFIKESTGKERSMTSPLSIDEVAKAFGTLRDKDKTSFSYQLKMLKGMSRDVFGTWMPIIKLKSFNASSGGAPVGTDISAVFNTVANIQASLLAGISVLWTIFDEYRPVGPFKVYFTPSDTSTSRLYAIGVIDYSNATALASVQEGLLYDTFKIFDVEPYHTEHSGIAEWKGRLIGQPDLLWVTTGTDATYAYWKSYSFNVGDSSWTISATYGYITFDIEIEFRQLNQGG